MEAEQVDVVVVGTGWNGLICAKTYLDLAPEANLILVDQASSFGGVWAAEKIYPSLYAQIKFGQFEYSFYPMRREGISNDGYISGATIHRYLQAFAHDFNLAQRTRFNTTVRNVVRLPDGRGWRLEFEGDGKRPVECAKLIYASGATSHPVVPSWSRSNFDVPIIHSQETGTHLDALAKIQRATVIGGAKSAFDTVFLLLDAGKQVDWIIRPDESGSGPVALMPPTIFGLVNSMDVIATRFMATLGASIMSTDGPGYRFFHRTRLGRLLTREFWKMVNLIAELHAGYNKSPNAQKLRPLPHGNGIFWANAGLGAASVPNFWKVFHAGDCTVHRTGIESFTDNKVHLSNGTQLATDYVVLCTGFDKSYQPFSRDLQRLCGLIPSDDLDPADAKKWAELEARAEEAVDRKLPILRNPPLTRAQVESSTHREANGSTHGPSRHYRRLIAPGLAAQGDRSILFPGFIHSIYTPLVSEVQALWGCAFLLGLLDDELPSQADMEREVAEWNVWTRKRYPAQGRKHAYAIYDFLAYVDTLLGDLGINTRRKSSVFAHVFLPTYPRDYRGLVEEFRRLDSRGKADDGSVLGRFVLVVVVFLVVIVSLAAWFRSSTY
ncbi:hypothetical protein C8A03DRAFT_41919 [Achaetomium macrosporum]|uniref:Uncharacterized protein n=1 Tax=Achaetomium macrosporum TaxID=79813 RepID=A0AAN7CGT3_9PEZI|nr:hypothetical protein C8A03DRAFT_41919 [Achaetomium macrosporum]